MRPTFSVFNAAKKSSWRNIVPAETLPLLAICSVAVFSCTFFVTRHFKNNDLRISRRPEKKKLEDSIEAARVHPQE